MEEDIYYYYYIMMYIRTKQKSYICIVNKNGLVNKCDIPKYVAYCSDLLTLTTGHGERDGLVR